MARFDVRNNENDPIDVIVFDDNSFVFKPHPRNVCDNTLVVPIRDEDEGYIEVDLKSVPDLIKALKKAQELWGDAN